MAFQGVNRMLDGRNCLPLLVFSCIDLCSQCERSLHAMTGLLSSLNHARHVELLVQNRFLRKKGVPIDLIERVKVAMDMAQPPSPSAATRPTRTRLASGRLASQVSR